MNIEIKRRRIYCKTPDDFALLLFLLKAFVEYSRPYKGKILRKSYDGLPFKIGEFEIFYRKPYMYEVKLHPVFFNLIKHTIPRINTSTKYNVELVKSKQRFDRAIFIYYGSKELGFIGIDDVKGSYRFFYKK